MRQASIGNLKIPTALRRFERRESDLRVGRAGDSSESDNPSPPAKEKNVLRHGVRRLYNDFNVPLNCWFFSFSRFAVLMFGARGVVFFGATLPHDGVALFCSDLAWWRGSEPERKEIFTAENSRMARVGIEGRD